MDREEQSSWLLRLLAFLFAQAARHQIGRQQNDVARVRLFLLLFTPSFLYAQLEQDANTSLLSVIDEFKFLSALKGQDYKQMLQEFSTYEKTFNQLANQGKKPKCAPNDFYPEKMKKFHADHVKAVEAVRELANTVDELYKEFVKKYGRNGERK